MAMQEVLISVVNRFVHGYPKDHNCECQSATKQLESNSRIRINSEEADQDLSVW